MKEALRQTIRELTILDGAPGFEEPVVKYLAAQFEKTGAAVEVDNMGNLYARLGDPLAKPKLMIAAHSDEIAGIVRHIDENGFLRIDALGGLIPAHLAAQRVHVDGHLGVIGVRPGHLQSPEERLRVPPVEELFVDVGASTGEEVIEMGIHVGSPVTYHVELASFTNSNRITGKALDNRIGCAVLLQLCRELEGQQPGGRLTGVVAVQEEVGLRGATVAAFRAMPDYAIVVDTLPVGDTPGVSRERMPGAIGRGPVLVIAAASGRTGRGHIAHPKVQRWLETAAAEENLPFQLSTSVGFAVTDAAAIHLSRQGVPTGVLGLPRRYSHSPICTFDLNDAVAAVRLLRQFVANMAQHTDLSFI